MKATITVLRKLNKGLKEKGVDIDLHEDVKKNGKWNRHGVYRQWGKHVGSSRQIMEQMLETYEILGIEIPKGL